MAKATPTASRKGRRARAPAKPAKSSPKSSASPRKAAAEARRQDILTAALAVFAQHGFEAARLDDVAKRAGVAKGTLYLYFTDKEALFEELIRSVVGPVKAGIEAIAADPALPAMDALQTVFAVFQRDVLGTERKLLLRLIMAEGPRFPAIADFYYREVVAPGLALMRGLAIRAARDGQLAGDALARHPQLIVAPLVMAVVWDGLFSRIEPLDVGALLRAHAQVLSGKTRKGAS